MGGDVPHDYIVGMEERVFEFLVVVAKARPDLGVHGDGLAKIEHFPVLLEGVTSGSLHEHVRHISQASGRGPVGLLGPLPCEQKSFGRPCRSGTWHCHDTFR